MKIKKVILYIWDISKGLYRSLCAYTRKTKGVKFHLFGNAVALRYFFKRDFDSFFKYWLNPVVLFRFPEFHFTLLSNNWDSKKILDISSPRLFSSYLLKNKKNIDLTMFNPDKQDILETKKLFLDLKIKTEHIEFIDSLYNLKKTFSIIYCISVIEHIIDSEENLFLQKIYSLLENEGLLILTVPVASNFRIEYKTHNSYGLKVPKNEEGEFFYQRIYDESSLKSRIIDCWKDLGGSLMKKEVFGLKENFNWDEYLIRRKTFKLKEMQKDIIYARKFINKYTYMRELPGRGVCGIVLKK